MTIEIIVKITEHRPCDICLNYIDEIESTIKVLGDYKAMKNLAKHLPLDDFRFHQVQTFLNWFEPAWESLSSEQQLILETLYMGDESNSNAEILLTLGLGLSLQAFYPLKKKALTTLAQGLYEINYTK